MYIRCNSVLYNYKSRFHLSQAGGRVRIWKRSKSESCFKIGWGENRIVNGEQKSI
jgi:hypothetical protein